jgi:hypothetical protein
MGRPGKLNDSLTSPIPYNSQLITYLTNVLQWFITIYSSFIGKASSLTQTDVSTELNNNEIMRTVTSQKTVYRLNTIEVIGNNNELKTSDQLTYVYGKIYKDKDILCLLDNGSQRNIIDLSQIQDRQNINKKNCVQLMSASDHIIPVVGQYKLCISFGKLTTTIDCTVVEKFQCPLLLSIHTFRTLHAIIDYHDNICTFSLNGKHSGPVSIYTESNNDANLLNQIQCFKDKCDLNILDKQPTYSGHVSCETTRKRTVFFLTNRIDVQPGASICLDFP